MMLELNIGFHNKVNMPNAIINAFFNIKKMFSWTRDIKLLA
jgi:hypothetical protein